MRITSKKIAALCLPLVLAVPVAEAADDEGFIKYRQSVMKSVGGHMGAIVGIIKGEVPYTDQLVGHAEGLNGLSMMVSEAFSKETKGGETRAKAEIWAKSAEFNQKVKDLQSATAAFLSAAKSGGVDAAKAKMGAVGDACKGCHEDFREKKS